VARGVSSAARRLAAGSLAEPGGGRAPGESLESVAVSPPAPVGAAAEPPHAAAVPLSVRWECPECGRGAQMHHEKKCLLPKESKR
jgi:hypothetical protein